MALKFNTSKQLRRYGALSGHSRENASLSAKGSIVEMDSMSAWKLDMKLLDLKLKSLQRELKARTRQ